MRILYIFLFIFSYGVYANEFYLYPAKYIEDDISKLKVFDKDIKVQSVFSPAEQQILKSYDKKFNIFKITTILNETQIKKLIPKSNIEAVNSIKLKSDYISQQWHLKNKEEEVKEWISDIDFKLIKSIADEDIQLSSYTPKRKIKIAIIDSGIDLTHPDLQHAIVKNDKECSALNAYKLCLENEKEKNLCHQKYTKIDNNNNGYPLDCNGWNFTESSLPLSEVDGTPYIKDTLGHGTHIAGIVAANGKVKGIFPEAIILPIKVALSSESNDPIENIAKGVLYAINNQVDIINLSLGWRFQYDSLFMRKMIKLAKDNNILIVVAAGNDSHSDVSYPCAYSGVICVGSHNRQGLISEFSNNGTQVDILAPGTNILSTWPTNKRSRIFTPDDDYEIMSGTSQAAPMVSAALGILLSQGLTPDQASLKLLATARNMKKQSYIRSGKLSIRNALRSDIPFLIYPDNKEAYLIQYADNKNSYSFKLKLITFGNLPKNNVKLSLTSESSNVKIVNPEFELKESSKTYKVQIHIDNIEESELNFRLHTPYKSYGIRANIIRVLQPSTKADDIQDIQLNQIPINGNLVSFKNLSDHDTHDFINIASDLKSFQIIQNNNLSKVFKIKEDNITILNTTKLDIDFDGEDDYFISYIHNNEHNQKITKFIIIDHSLNYKRHLVSPNNSFDNNNTFIPGKFTWFKQNGQLNPMWVGFGTDPMYQDNPWTPSQNFESNYLYILTSQGLRVLDILNNEIPLNIIKDGNKNILITASDIGFYTQFNYYNIETDLNAIEVSRSSFYFDQFYLKPLSNNSNSLQIFFHEQNDIGEQNILYVNKQNERLTESHYKLKLKDKSVSFIHSINKNRILFQTKHLFGVKDLISDNYSLRESKIKSDRRRVLIISDLDSFFIPAKEHPGLTNEIITYHGTKLVSLAKYRVLPIKGCTEIGILKKEKTYLAFQCLEARKIKLITVSK